MAKCDIALFSFILSLKLTLTPRKTPPWEMKGEIDSIRVKLYLCNGRQNAPFIMAKNIAYIFFPHV